MGTLGPQGGGTVNPSAVSKSKSSRPSRRGAAQRKVPSTEGLTPGGDRDFAVKRAARSARARTSRKTDDTAVIRRTAAARKDAGIEKDDIASATVAERVAPDSDREISFSKVDRLDGKRENTVAEEAVERSTPDRSLLERSRSAAVGMWDKCMSFLRSLVRKE